MSGRCLYCETTPPDDGAICRTRADALACASLPEATRERALASDRAMAETLDRVTMRDVFYAARRMAKRKRDPNWMFAMQLFGLGSNYAYGMCERLGVDPDGTSAESIAVMRAVA